MRPEYIDKAAAYIEETLAGELDVGALAGALYVSPAQLSAVGGRAEGAPAGGENHKVIKDPV